MRKTKVSIFKRYLLQYRNWKARRQMRILNTMIKHSFDEALRLANQKRDIINHKVWVLAGQGIFIVFARYQMKNLQLSKIIDKHITGKELDEKASYITLPYTNADHKRGGILRNYLPNK
jgi:hypothetical protein